MDNKSVIVLAPNGRRQTVRVNPNTTILQILEDVCKKQGLPPETHEIKHHNKCLDTSTIMRFSGLPNNAQLELVEAAKVRLEGIVTLGIQLENGTRLMDTFTPSTFLSDVLLKMCPEESNPTTNPVLIYMRREIYGENAFKVTTLKSLGLTNGRAMLRLIHRSPEELHTQANVSAPLPSKPVEEKPYIRTFQKIDSPPRELNIPSQILQQPVKEEVVSMSDTTIIKEDNLILKLIKEEKLKREKNTTKENDKSAKSSKEVEKEKTVGEEIFVFLGARNAMVFSQETAQVVPSEELPEDFFDLTLTDAKKLLKDLKRRRLELENTPLQTATLRNLQESTRQLSQLNKYKQCIIRVNFPDHTVLQGTFSPIDTIRTVKEFVGDYLENKNMDFYLYTAPPKTILNEDTKLLDSGCVPNAILHFGTTDLSKDLKYLKADLFSKYTTASVASLAAAKIRQETTRTGQNIIEDDDISLDEVNVGASTSSGVKHYEDYQTKRSKSIEKDQVPKWFKPNK